METTVQDEGSIDAAVDAILEPALVEEEKTDEQAEELENETNETLPEEASDDEAEDTDEKAEDDDDQEDEYDTEEPEDQEAQVFSVQVDGKEEQVTLEDLKRGYSGQKYVQQGMERAANQQKQAEQAFNSLVNERQQLGNLFNQFVSGQLMPPPMAPSMEMLQADPIGYIEAKANFEQQTIAFNQQMQGLMQQMQPSEGEAIARQTYLQSEAEKLREVMPELSDESKAGKVKEMIAQAGVDYGYAPEELAQVADHRALRILLDAAKYREVMAGKAKADEKAAGAVRKGKPLKAGARKIGTGKAEALKRQKSQLKRSGSINDALGMILG